MNEFPGEEVKLNLVRKTYFACAVDWQLGGELSL